MVRVAIDNLGLAGIHTDPHPHTLPPEIFTAGQNVRFSDNRVESTGGYAEVMATPGVAPYWAIPVVTSSEHYWVYAGLAAVYVYDDISHYDITRASGAYSATALLNWTGGLLGGVLCINNAVDAPQYWASNATSQLLQDLTAWPSGYTCKILVPYKQHLIALNMSQGGVEYPHRILWSHVADPGTIPSSWDISDATKDAGQTEISDINSGGFVDAVQLGDVLVLYKSNSIHYMQPSYDNNIFSFKEMFKEVGCMANHCVMAIPTKRKHLVATGADLVIHDGQSMESILTNKQRRSLLKSIDSDNYATSFMVVKSSKEEIWFCYPRVGQSLPSEALVYNYETGAIGHRDLPMPAYIASGAVAATTPGAWDSDGDTWASDTSLWNNVAPNPGSRSLVMCVPGVTKMYEADSTNLADGVIVNSYVERQGLAVVGKDRLGNPRVDLERRKLISRIWPKLEGGPVTIKVLSQETLDGPISYSSGMTFDPATDRYVDLEEPLSGLLLGIRVESAADVSWRLSGYDLELEVLGDF